jgi:2-C-methyl-D-erythritol 2,4-cyclodiphosphate synthase
MSGRVGSGIDVHAFAPAGDVGADGATVLLAGVSIPAPAPLAGHSDADVVAHAIIDALLGAAGLGDIGTRFGIDDPALSGADSMGLLATVGAELATAGWCVGNLDVTVVALVPRLGPHREAMRTALARVLGVDPTAVSVKATTTDGLGSIGRAEGVAAWAVCLLERIELPPSGPVARDPGH